jgi:hypothetical protein
MTDLTQSGTGYDAAQPVALLIGAPGGEMAAALAGAGYRLRAVPLAEGLGALAAPGGIDLIAIEAENATEALLAPLLTLADAIARDVGTAVLASVDTARIDLGAAMLTAPSTQLLCEPGAGDRAAALAFARLAPGLRLTDTSRDGEIARLRLLHEEVARIAETLTRLTRGEAPIGPGVRAPESGYRGPDEPANSGDAASAGEIRATIRSRRLRAQFFQAELFADPAWDMLLDLFAAHLESRRVSVSSLCIAAAVPPTTALRWIGTLHDAELFERRADPQDRRRAYIGLSPKGIEAMHAYARGVRRAGLHLV